MNRPTHAIPPPDAGKVRGDWKIDGGIRTDALLCFEAGLGCVGGDGGRSKTEGGASLLGDGTFSRCCRPSRVSDRGLMWLPLGLSHRVVGIRSLQDNLPSSARLGMTGRAANQTARIRPERMGDWICKAGGVGNLECYAEKKDDDGPQAVERKD